MTASAKTLRALPIRHLGLVAAICGIKNERTERIHRVDLGYARYLQLGVKERFSGQEKYRVCARCLATIKAQEINFLAWRRNRAAALKRKRTGRR